MNGRDVAYWHECDLRAAPNNVRSWESNGLNADVAFGPFMTHCGRKPDGNPAAQQSSAIARCAIPFLQMIGPDLRPPRDSRMLLMGGPSTGTEVKRETAHRKIRTVSQTRVAPRP